MEQRAKFLGLICYEIAVSLTECLILSRLQDHSVHRHNIYHNLHQTISEDKLSTGTPMYMYMYYVTAVTTVFENYGYIVEEMGTK